MPDPSLRKTRGRTLPLDQKTVRIIGYSGFIYSSSYVPPTSNYAQSQKAESVYSNKAAVTLTDEYIPVPVYSSLSNSFPSIHAARRTLSTSCKSKKLQEYLAAAEVFLHCVATVIDQIRDTPNVDHADPSYLSAMSSLVFAGGYFVASIANLHSAHGHQVEGMLNESYNFVRLLYGRMSDFLGAAIRTTFKSKPLPELPSEVALQVVEEPKITLESPSSSNSYLSESLKDADESTGLIDIHFSKDENSKPLKHRITWQIPKCASPLGSSKHFIFSFKLIKSITSRSSATLVQPDGINPAKLSFRADIEPSCPSTTNGGIHHSVLFYPLNPDSDIEMPMPTGEVSALSFDAEGKIKGGSLPALVAVLTSRQGVTDHELTTTIYTYFRCFTTPILFFQELAKRYEEPQPADLTNDQARVWETNISIVRIRVAKVMHDWLDQYWRTESDDEILEDMQIFAEERVEMPGHPKAILHRVVEKINHMKRISPKDALATRAQELVARVELTMPQEPPTPTGFIFSERFSRDLVAQLQQFNNSAGREEFARQLTMKLSSMFRDVDPIDVVAFWRSSQKKQGDNVTINSAAISKAIKAIAMFEQTLSIWVTYSIIKPNEPLDRCSMISFWLDIAIVRRL
jgi:hypothetical protein